MVDVFDEKNKNESMHSQSIQQTQQHFSWKDGGNDH
jgi:hypothetical protein